MEIISYGSHLRVYPMDLMAIEVGKSLNSNSPKVFYSMVDFGDTPEVTVLMVKKHTPPKSMYHGILCLVSPTDRTFLGEG